jgi:hypothetical protein
MSTVNNGPQIVRNGLALSLDASSVTSFSAIAVYKVECYSSYSGGLRSANYSVQYSDDNSTWTTAFSGAMSNNSTCGIITGTNRNTSNYGKHRYWRYVEGAAIAGHHPRVSRIDFITKGGAVYNLVTYTNDNCADGGEYIIGTVSKDFVYPLVEVLIVAGGGSGGVDNGGGGGGGGVIYRGLNIAVNTSYSIVVGAGGAARLGSSDDGPGNNGANSTAFGYTAIGGSGGTGWVNPALPPGSATYVGGSGGGQSASTGGVNAVGAGTRSGFAASNVYQGNNGGAAVAAFAGGGGGAGGVGGNASAGNVGAGGEGLYVGNLFGTSIGVGGYVAGGGAGGFDAISNYISTLPFTRNGTVKKLTQTGEDACPNNTGAGGNGGNHNNNTSGAGGSGIVLIRYYGPQRATGGTVYNFNGYTVHQFNSNGTFEMLPRWLDVSGNNRNATLTNGPLYNTSNGGNILFDGSNDYAIMPSGGSYSEYTFMFFCKWISDTTNGSRLFGCDAFGTYTIFTPSNVGFHYNQAAGSTTTISSGANIGLGTWCHVAVTVSALSTFAYIYINGTLRNGSNTPPYVNLSGNLFLGAQNTGASVLANCNIAAFQLYNKVLSASEIMQNFQANKSKFGL